MFHTARFVVNILIVGFFIANLVKENAGCNTLLEVGNENNYLANSKLLNLFHGFNQAAGTVQQSEEIQKKLVYPDKFLELLISVEKVKLELMSRGEWKVLVQKTMRELCDGPNADDLWLKFILRAAIELKVLLKPAMSNTSSETQQRTLPSEIFFSPRPG